MTKRPDFRPAAAADLGDIQALLKGAGLPFEDLSARNLEHFIVLRNASGELLAAGGLEVYRADALLRSVVVSDEARGTGLGRMIVQALEQHARLAGVRTLYLLTTTAEEFFPRLGYQSSARTAVPAGVAGSAEFASLCPASAACLKKILE